MEETCEDVGGGPGEEIEALGADGGDQDFYGGRGGGGQGDGEVTFLSAVQSPGGRGVFFFFLCLNVFYFGLRVRTQLGARCQKKMAHGRSP